MMDVFKFLVVASFRAAVPRFPGLARLGSPSKEAPDRANRSPAPRRPGSRRRRDVTDVPYETSEPVIGLTHSQAR